MVFGWRARGWRKRGRGRGRGGGGGKGGIVERKREAEAKGFMKGARKTCLLLVNGMGSGSGSARVGSGEADGLAERSGEGRGNYGIEKNFILVGNFRSKFHSLVAFCPPP
jgi:hypothetical protein